MIFIGESGSFTFFKVKTELDFLSILPYILKTKLFTVKVRNSYNQIYLR